MISPFSFTYKSDVYSYARGLYAEKALLQLVEELKTPGISRKETMGELILLHRVGNQSSVATILASIVVWLQT